MRLVIHPKDTERENIVVGDIVEGTIFRQEDGWLEAYRKVGDELASVAVAIPLEEVFWYEVVPDGEAGDSA